MNITQYVWKIGRQEFGDAKVSPNRDVSMALVFGSKAALSQPGNIEELKYRFPMAEILIGSTAGEIIGTEVFDDTISITALQFDKTQVRSAQTQLSATMDRHNAGKAIATALQAPDLALIIMLADGQNVNGSELVTGLNETLHGRVPVVGGLAGDGSTFESTLVGLNARPEPGNIAAIGLYGQHLHVNFGSQGGWEPFGPQRIVTASKGNVLYELDGLSALELYKSYLGDLASGLPGTGLLFPLGIKVELENEITVRTLLSIDEQESSLTFAGDIPLGSVVRLMRSSPEKLLDGARSAALACRAEDSEVPQLAILVSCIGRKLVLNQRIEEEIEEVQAVLGNTALCGFYSYGELSPTGNQGECVLHNQTMTITTISES